MGVANHLCNGVTNAGPLLSQCGCTSRRSSVFNFILIPDGEGHASWATNWRIVRSVASKTIASPCTTIAWPISLSSSSSLKANSCMSVTIARSLSPLTRRSHSARTRCGAAAWRHVFSLTSPRIEGATRFALSRAHLTQWPALPGCLTVPHVSPRSGRRSSLLSSGLNRRQSMLSLLILLLMMRWVVSSKRAAWVWLPLVVCSAS
jgi:hypothetical protein